MPHITRADAAEVLFRVAAILDIADDNPYRVHAYRRAARIVMEAPEPLEAHLTPRRRLDLPGLGPSLRIKLGELVATGHMRFGIEVAARMPEEAARLTAIPAIGPRTAQRLYEELGITTAEELVAAAQAGKIRALHGFGAVRERQLLEGAERVLAGFRKVPATPPTDLDAGLPEGVIRLPLPTLPEAA